MSISTVAENLQCYNRGCQKKFDLSNNKNDACCHHPGVPVFHDALKGWSCCKKRSTDFTMFLNMPGCTYGFHSNEKPVALTERPGIEDEVKKEEEVVEVNKPVENKPVAPSSLVERPSSNEDKIRIDVTINEPTKNSLKKQLDFLSSLKVPDDHEKSAVAIGTSCKRSGCKKQYDGVSIQKCLHHPGSPVFHEGMKFWSCCTRKTSDFSKFLEQEGCKTIENHLWTLPSDSTSEILKPRVDWFQTGTNVSVSLFNKFILPESVKIELNQVQMTVEFSALSSSTLDRPVYKNVFDLSQIIAPLECSAKIMPSKLEIKLRKGGPTGWKTLELIVD